MPRIRIFQPEGIVVDVELVVVFPRQNPRKYLATNTLICRLSIVHRVLSVLKPNFFVFPKVLKEHVVAIRMAFHFKLSRTVCRSFNLFKHFNFFLSKIGRRSRVDHPVEDVDQSVVLNVVLLQDRSLHEVHVADRDGRKVEVVERRRQRVHVRRRRVRREVLAGSKDEDGGRRQRDDEQRQPGDLFAVPGRARCRRDVFPSVKRRLLAIGGERPQQ